MDVFPAVTSTLFASHLALPSVIGVELKNNKILGRHRRDAGPYRETTKDSCGPAVDRVMPHNGPPTPRSRLIPPSALPGGHIRDDRGVVRELQTRFFSGVICPDGELFYIATNTDCAPMVRRLMDTASAVFGAKTGTPLRDSPAGPAVGPSRTSPSLKSPGEQSACCVGPTALPQMGHSCVCVPRPLLVRGH
jgi:hypothetical protein